MASLDFAKYTKSGAGGMAVHFDPSMRSSLNHSNKNINQELTENNYMIGTDSYAESLYRLDVRTQEVDELIPPKRIREDRVVCDMCYVPCPNEIEDKDLFFEKSYEFLAEYFGADNVHGGFVHKDEVHEYRDSRVRDEHDHQAIKESMEHMHVMISPCTAEKGINSKSFNTKTMFKNIQKEFDKMVYQEFGVHYNTKEQALGLKVEELKQATELIVEKEQQLHQLEHDVNRLEQKHDQLLQVQLEPRKKIKEVEPIEMGLIKKEQYVHYEDYQMALKLNKRLLEDRNTLIDQKNVLETRNKALEDDLKEIKSTDLYKENDALKSKLEGFKNKLHAVENELGNWKYEYSKIFDKNLQLEEKVTSLTNSLELYKEMYEQLIHGFRELTEQSKEIVQNWFTNNITKYFKDDIALQEKEERQHSHNDDFYLGL